jgi:hypothetical protein
MEGLEGYPPTSNLRDGLLGRLGPDERDGLLIVVGDVGLDGFDELGNAAETRRWLLR